MPPANVVNTTGSSRRVTELLLSWGAGDESALERLVPLVFSELRSIARRHMRSERNGHVLQTTALVNEAYMRLVDLSRVKWQDRAHFLAMASRLMRRVLVDFSRANSAIKRGAGATRVPIDEDSLVAEDPGPDLLALDDALTALATIDPRKSQVVEMRFFGGFSVDETAEVIGVSRNTVMRDWQLARAWLFREVKRRGR